MGVAVRKQDINAKDARDGAVWGDAGPKVGDESRIEANVIGVDHLRTFRQFLMIHVHRH